MPTLVFVYGTLMPGHLRWPLLEPHAVASRRAEVRGLLFDTGRGWPAARFNEPLGAHPIPHPRIGTIAGAGTGAGTTAARVPGWLVELVDSAAAEVLALLDEVEDATVDHRAGWPPVGGPPDGGRVRPARPAAGPGEYRRIRVRTEVTEEAWAYETLSVHETWSLVAAWADQSER